MAERPPRRARPRSPRPRRLLRPFACAAGRRPDAGLRRVLGGRPQRHGQDHAVQDHHGPVAGERRLGSRPRRGYHPPQPGADRKARRRLCPARAAAVALAQRRRASEPRRRDAARRLDHRAHLRNVSASCRAQGPRRRPALRRRTADAGDLARAADQSAAADHGRADRRAGAGDRRAGRGDAGAARRGRRDVGARDRAEYRRRHGDLQKRRDHGQWPHQPHHRLGAAGRRPRAAAAPAWGWRRWRPRRAGIGYRRR